MQSLIELLVCLCLYVKVIYVLQPLKLEWLGAALDLLLVSLVSTISALFLYNLDGETIELFTTIETSMHKPQGELSLY